MKKNIAIFFGGCSPEYNVSLESAYSVIRNLDLQKYKPITIGISSVGKWYLFTGNIEQIKANTWENSTDCFPAVLSPDRGSRKLLVFRHGTLEEIIIDVALPILHGKNSASCEWDP